MLSGLLGGTTTTTTGILTGLGLNNITNTNTNILGGLTDPLSGITNLTGNLTQ